MKVKQLIEKQMTGAELGRQVQSVLSNANLLHPKKTGMVRVSGARSENIQNINIQLFDQKVKDLDAAHKLLKKKFGHIRSIKNSTRPETGQLYGTGRKLPVTRIQFNKDILQ